MIRSGRLIIAFLTLVAIAGLAIYIVGWWIPAIIALVSPVVWLESAWKQRTETRVGREFRRKYPDRPMLIVYTDSPHWKSIIEQEWIPRWEDVVVPFNHSQPWRADQIEARLWRSARSYDHTPLAIVLTSADELKVVRLFSAFRDNKHGRSAKLRAAEDEIATALVDIRAA